MADDGAFARGGQDGTGFVREADIFRGDKTVSRVMLRRNARLYSDRLEVYHLRDKASPELELVAYLKNCKVGAITEAETDVKPPGANLFVSLLSGSVQSQMLVRESNFKLASTPRLCSPSAPRPSARSSIYSALGGRRAPLARSLALGQTATSHSTDQQASPPTTSNAQPAPCSSRSR